MTDKYQLYEAECERLRAENQKLLEGFQAWLTDKGLKRQTVRRHAINLDLFLNYFLLYDEPVNAARGVFSVSMFLAYWYPRKVLGSETALRGAAVSLGKFYRFMQAQNMASEEAVRSIQGQISSSLPEGLAKIRQAR
jgi:hypothetical protein